MQLIPYIIMACWAAFIIFWIISAFNVKRNISRSPWQRLAWVRVSIALVVIGWIWGTSSWAKVTNHLWFLHFNIYGPVGLAGAVLCVVGIGIAIWARVYLGRNWSGSPSLKQDHELVTSGPYALVRHPIYTGIMIATLGSTLASPVWLIMFFVVTALFIWRVHVEEALMMHQFPTQYPEYKKRTWALIPWVW